MQFLANFDCLILIKIIQCQCRVTIFLQNRTTDFDETLYVAWVCLCEGFGNSVRSGYSLVQKKGGRRPPYLCELNKISKMNGSGNHGYLEKNSIPTWKN